MKPYVYYISTLGAVCYQPDKNGNPWGAFAKCERQAARALRAGADYLHLDAPLVATFVFVYGMHWFVGNYICASAHIDETIAHM